MGPFNLTADWGSTISYLVPLLVGIGFGAALEMSGFGDSRKLAAQFYFKDLTVLKVMFTAIIVASALLMFSSAFGWINFDAVFVNPTYLMPGLVGGLIMGVGFIVGGFCPGTSLVAASTLKIDGIFFALGVALGVFGFGETVGLYDGFFHSSFFGRLTLPEFFEVDAGIVLVGVILMALLMFLLSEIAEQYFGRQVPGKNLRLLSRNPRAWLAMGLLVSIGATAAIKGQPDAETKWQQIKTTAQLRIDTREVYVHPMETAELIGNTAIYLHFLDLRPEADYNLFHLKDAQLLAVDDLRETAVIRDLKTAPANTVFVTVSNDEKLATEAWRLLAAQGVDNIYIAEGGINNWLNFFPPEACLAIVREGEREVDQLAYEFYQAAGGRWNTTNSPYAHKYLPLDCYLSANPGTVAHSGAGDLSEGLEHQAVEFEHKVKLQARKATLGGCS